MDATWAQQPGNLRQHVDPANSGRMSAREYVQRHRPIESVYLFGENWLTQVTTMFGTTLISEFAELFEYMRLKGWSFYEPVSADMFTVDEFGKLHLADGVILRVRSQFSSSLDIFLGADALEDLLFSWSNDLLLYPAEVIDFLKLMRSPHLQPEYLMLIHPAGVLRHLRGPLYMRFFDFVIHDPVLKVKDQTLLFEHLAASGWNVGTTKDNVLLKSYIRNGHYDPDDPRDGMYFRRATECHVFGFLKTLSVNGFPYSREDQQLLVHARCGMFCSYIQSFLFCNMAAKGGRELLKRLKTEDFFCKIGFCCPVGLCKRVNCFDHEVMRTCDMNDPEIRAVVNAANIIRSHSSCDYITKRPIWLLELNNSSYCRQPDHRQLALVTCDYVPTKPGGLAVKKGDMVEILFGPEHHVRTTPSFPTHRCYIRDFRNNEGFVHVSYLQKYRFFSYRGRRSFP